MMEYEEHDLFPLVGKPIHVTQMIDPSQAEIDRLHSEYLQAIEQLYDSNKTDCGFEHVNLDVV